jgi:hypothetical protein
LFVPNKTAVFSTSLQLFLEHFHKIGAAEIRDVYMKPKPKVAPIPRSQIIAQERLKKGIHPLTSYLQTNQNSASHGLTKYPNFPASHGLAKNPNFPANRQNG